MRLTFENNNFVLHDPAILLKVKWPNNAETLAGWQKVSGTNSLKTNKIKAAVRFRSVADSKALKIFDKLLLKDLPLPTGGVLFPKDQKLLPFQLHQGIPHILSRNRSYLAHQPGLGKSAQFICAASSKPGPALILCPSFLKMNWVREITKWYADDFPEIAIVPEAKKINEMNWNADFVICSDAMILNEAVRNKIEKTYFRTMAIDEAHRFKDPNAFRTIALFGGRKQKPKSKEFFRSQGLIYNKEHVVALSGTPMLARPIELWPILFAMAPELIDFMSYENFGFKFCGPTRNEMGAWEFLGSSNEKELSELISPRFLQRIKKTDVLKDLPRKVRDVIIVDEDLRSKEVIALDKKLLDRFLQDFEKPQELGDWAKLRHANGLAKVKFGARFVFEILSQDREESILLFAHHRDVVDILRTKLLSFNPEVINGGISNKERTRIEDAFQSGKCRLVIGNINAMGLGLTLTKATRVVFVEYSWTPSDNEQAEDRANRIGSEWSIFCQYLVLPDSIDETILSSSLNKEERIERILG